MAQHTTQHGIAQHTAQHSTRCSTTQHSIARHSTAQQSTTKHSTARQSTTQHNMTRHGTAHNTVQRSTVQHSTRRETAHGAACLGLMLATICHDQEMPSMCTSSACTNYVPAIYTHLPSNDHQHREATRLLLTTAPAAGGLWPPLSDHPSRASTTGTERQPVSPWPVHPQPDGPGLPSVTNAMQVFHCPLPQGSEEGHKGREFN